MGRGRRLVLPLFLLSLPAVRAHDHQVITEEMANAPVDAMLWIHIFLQASVWGILFPIGMVLGLSRSRWHVPLQVRRSPPPFCSSSLKVRDRPRASRSLLLVTSWGTHTAAGSSLRAHMARSQISSSLCLLRSSHLACTSNCTYTNEHCGPGPCARMASSESHTPCLGGRRCCLARSCFAGTVGMTHCLNVWRIISWCVPV